MSAAVAVAVLVAGGIFLILQRGLLRAALGLVMLGNAANVAMLAAGGMDRRSPPLVGSAGEPADPLVQGFVLTAIVIAFGATIYLLSLARSGRDDEDGEDDS